MTENPALLKMGYVVKMFPRLSETFILNEMLELERRGVEIVVFSIKKPNEGRFHPQVSSLKAKVIYLEDLDVKKWHSWIGEEWPVLSNHAQNLWSVLGDLLAGGDARRIDEIWWGAWVAAQALKLGLKRLHAHFASMPSTVAYFAHRISGIPFSFTAHAKDIFVYTMDEHYLREKMLHASDVITVTHFNKRYLEDGAPEVGGEKIRVIHNGIDLERFRSDPAIARDPHLILGVGRLVPKKGFDDLLKACALLKERGDAFHCLIVGQGPEAEALEEMRVTLGLENEVTLAGPRHQEEVLSLMKQATMFCLPCTVAPDNNIDALPTVLLEALGCGLPSVSTTVSGIPEIINSGVDGFLVPPDDPVALSEKMSQLLADASLRREFSAKGREKAVRKFDLRNSVGALLDVHMGAGGGDRPDAIPPIAVRRARETQANSKPHVLYLCADRGIPFGGTKGCSIHVREFLEALDEADYPTRAVVARHEPKTEYVPKYPVDELPDSYATPFFGAAGELGLDRRAIADSEDFARNQATRTLLSDIHRGSGFDIIYERYSLLGVAGRMFAREVGVPFVLEVNAPLVLEAAKYRKVENPELAKAVEKYLFSTADHVTAVSGELKDYILRIAPETQVTVIPNGVNVDRFGGKATRKSMRGSIGGLNGRDFVVGFVGRVRPWHGVDLLLEALEALVEDDENLQLCIVGETGDLQSDLEARCRSLGLTDRVSFTGSMAPDAIPGVLRAMDVLVAPYPELSEFYFSPLKVFEYMAAGKPIVASAIGQIREILRDEYSALLVPPGDIQALQSALRRLRGDASLRRRLAENAQSEVGEKHTWRQRLAVVGGIFRSLGDGAQEKDRIGHADSL